MDCELKVDWTEDQGEIKEIMTNKRLASVSLPNDDLQRVMDGTFEPDTVCKYLNVKRDGHLIGIIRLYPISNITTEIHPMLCPTQWGRGISHLMQKELEKFLISETKYCKMLIQTPQCCRQVLQACVREGFQLEGILTSAIYWRDSIENIVVMSKFLNR